MVKRICKKVKRVFKKPEKLSKEEKLQKILSALPSGVVDFDSENLISVFEFSRTRENEKTNGVCVATDRFLYSFENGDVTEKVMISNIEKFEYRAYVGLAGVEYTLDGKTHILCKDGASSGGRFSNVVKRLNLYLESGKYGALNLYDVGKVCPNCLKPYGKNSSICKNCTSKKQIFKRVGGLVGPYAKGLAVAVLLFFAATGVNLLSPYVNKILVDGYITGKKAELSVLAPYLLVILSMLGIYLINYLITIVRNLLMMRLGMKFIIDLRGRVFEKIHQLSLASIGRRTNGELMNRITRDTSHLESFIIAQLPNLMQEILLIVTVGTFLFIYEPMIALLVLVPIPLVVVALRSFNRFMHKNYRRQWQAGDKSTSVLFDIFSGIRIVKAFGTEKREESRYDEAIKNEKDIQVKNELMYNAVNPFLNIVFSLSGFFLLYYTGNAILGGKMTFGEASMISSYISLIYGQIGWLSSLPRILTDAYTSMINVFDILDEVPEVTDKENADEFKIYGNIRLEDVSFGYDENGDVLKNINLDIKSGEMIGIVGKSGVGKSTLINLIMRMYDVGSGSIKIDGVDIRDISQHSLRSQIGAVLQENFLFSGTIYNNIAYAKPGCTKREVIEASKAAGVHEFVVKLPDGYNTYVGEKGHTLSGGERQRVAIARALLHDPRILILDEATSALDTETEKSIQETVQKLIAGRTTIAIAHRLSTLRNATRLVVLDKGKVAEVGTHEELLKKHGIYYGLVMAQRQMSKLSS